MDALEDLVPEVLVPLPQLVGNGLDAVVQLQVLHLPLVTDLNGGGVIF